ncbi:MAG: hypothetical protein WBE28_07790 [bacterium]
MKRITAQSHIDEILAKYPSLSKTFIELGLPCLVCGKPFWGTIEELARQHDSKVPILVNVLNDKRREIDAKY